MSSSQQPQQQHTPAALTSTTAPGKVFTSRTDLANHYKSDWHRYNLKRRQAGLPVIAEIEFEARYTAAQEARRLQQEGAGGGKTDHLKDKTKKQRNKHQHNKKKQQSGNEEASSVVSRHQAKAYETIKMNNNVVEGDGSDATGEMRGEPKSAAKTEEGRESIMEEGKDPEHDNTNDSNNNDVEEDEQFIEIDPLQSLFDYYKSDSIESNVERMHKDFGFFIPDREYLTDLEGLVGYCHEKIQIGHLCLYCQRIFATGRACVQHMVDTSHCKLAYEPTVDMEDLHIFYDFEAANVAFLSSKGQGRTNKKAIEGEDGGEEQKMEVDDNDDDEEWEDVSEDDEEMEGTKNNGDDDDDDDDMYAGYEEQVLNMGFDVTPLGELVFPDGRIVGHRSLRRYYKQRARSSNSESAAVVAARNAANERLYRGRVYTLGQGGNTAPSSLALTSPLASHPISEVGAGRAGKGLLVPVRNNNATGGVGGASQSFSQLSIYRYRAAVRKQRKGRDIGRRMENKTRRNINRMDKKANNLMNGVIVPQAPR